MASSGVTDLEALVKDWAWTLFENSCTKEQKRLGKENVQITINWKRVRFDHSEPEYSEHGLLEPASQTLFKTFFTNNTKESQSYSFKTERVTRSCCEIAIEDTVTLGAEMSVSLACPFQVLSANAGFKKELSLTKSEGETFEEELTWGVDSQISVPPHHITTAELIVKESQFGGKFAVTTTVSGHVNTSLTNLRDNNSFMTAIHGNIVEIIKDSDQRKSIKNLVIEKNKAKFVTKGKCKFNFAIEQHVKLSQEEL